MSFSVCPTSKVAQLKQTLPCHSFSPCDCALCCASSAAWRPNHKPYQKADSAEMLFLLGYFSAESIPPISHSWTSTVQGNIATKCKEKKSHLTMSILNSLDNNSTTPRRAAVQMKLNWNEPLNIRKPCFLLPPHPLPFHTSTRICSDTR